MGAIGGEESTKSEERQAEKISEEKILVLIKVRPLSKKEREKNEGSDLECVNEKTIVFRNNLQERPMPPITHSFDRVFNGDCSTRQMYEEGAKGIALSVVSGINSSILAYGQTSSGKTYTMSGITEYAVADIYDYILKHQERAFVIKFSAMEIYNEVVTDLLCTDNTPLRIRDDPEKGAFVENLSEEILRDWGHLKELLSICKAQRRIGETSLNEASSRSHQIVRLTVESSAREYLGKENSTALSASLNFVDLAGSERSSQASSTGDRLKEGCHINSSLFTLGNVIRKLSGKGRQGHVSYRDSKLTHMLRPCLGGNARTAIICTLSPTRAHAEQSRNTLHFASCAKEVSTNAKVNIVMSDKALLKRLQCEVARLETELSIPAPSFTCNCAELLREKDLQIEKLEMEVRELTMQRDLAGSRVQDLQFLVENYQTARELGEKGNYSLQKDRCVEVRCIENDEPSEDEVSESTTLSTGDNVGNSGASMFHSHGNEAFVVENYQSSRELGERGDSPQWQDGYAEGEFSEDEVSKSDALSTGEDEETSTLTVHKYGNEAFESSSPHQDENTIAKFKKQWGLDESQGEKRNSPRWPDRCVGVQCIEMGKSSGYEFSNSGETTSTLPVHGNKPQSSSSRIDENPDLTKSRNLTLTRSTKFRSSKDLTGGLPPSFVDVSTRYPSKRMLSRLDYGDDIARLSTQDSISSRSTKTTPDEDFPSVDNFVAGLKGMAKLAFEKNIANSQGTEKRTETPNTNWTLIFVRLQKAILELWQICNISLVHRTYFFLLFKGDPTDSIYMEIELRRLSLLNEAFSKGNHAVEGGQTVTLESSIEALRREREMLCRLVSKKFSRSERDKLYEKWSINLESKQRKRQFVNLLWSDTSDLNRMIDSAETVGKLIGFSAQGTSLKEMFGLSLGMCRSRRSFSWN